MGGFAEYHVMCDARSLLKYVSTMTAALTKQIAK